MNKEFVAPFLSSFTNVLKTMARIDIEAGEASFKKDAIARGDVSGIISMIGNAASGSISISFEKKLALKLFHNLIGETVEHISSDITDMVGEITNMVAGGAKLQLGEQGYNFNMATPIVITGPSHYVAHKVEVSKVLMPFSCEWGNAYIEICFE